MIHWALAVIRTPTSTHAAMIRNQTAPTPVTRPTLLVLSGLNKETVAAPAGSAPATMKIVADTTRAQPERKPRMGCSARPTHE
jgi:hypothetical protein